VTDAYYRVGVLYEEGRGTEQDYRMAAIMYRKAAEKEHEDACYRLGRLYQYGNGAELNYSKACQFYKKAQEMGQAEAHKVLNITLETPLASNGDTKVELLDPLSHEYQNSLSMCKYVTERGDIEVQFRVGFAYEYIFLKPDYEEAFYWYSMAAESSHREAIYHLGLLYEKGLGIPQDYQKSIQLYNNAGHLGSDKALHQLGVAYHDGKGVDIDPSKAIEYYICSAKLGNPEYQYVLGKLYEEGQLVQKDPKEALKWYTKAYLQGYGDVSSNLYTMYDDKPYEDYFYTKLFRNLSIASRAHFCLNDKDDYDGYRDLNYRVATLCVLGYGTKKNLGEACAYLMKIYSNYRNLSVQDFFDYQHDFSVSEKLDILGALEENKTVMNQLEEDWLFEFADTLYQSLKEVQQHSSSTTDSQNESNLMQHSIIKKDYSRAFHWMKKAADMEESNAMLQLGAMYCSGHGVKKDTEQGERWFDMAIRYRLDFTERIAILFHESKDMQDFPLAHKWYKRLDVEGNSSYNKIAQLGSGLLYEYGDGVEQDYQTALEHYTKLAYQTLGMLRLGLMYYYGKGVAVDYRKSFDLFTSATCGRYYGIKLAPYVYNPNNLHGNDSQGDLVYCLVSDKEVRGEIYYYLGLQYKYGQFVPNDQRKAQHHFKEASSCGCKRAEYEVDYFHSNSNI
jgi:TPR repeat protein